MRVGLLHLGQSVDFVESITFLRSPVLAILAIAWVFLLRKVSLLARANQLRAASTARSNLASGIRRKGDSLCLVYPNINDNVIGVVGFRWQVAACPVWTVRSRETEYLPGAPRVAMLLAQKAEGNQLDHWDAHSARRPAPAWGTGRASLRSPGCLSRRPREWSRQVCASSAAARGPGCQGCAGRLPFVRCGLQAGRRE